MTDVPYKQCEEASRVRRHPELRADEDGGLSVVVKEAGQLETLMGMKTADAAREVFFIAVEALGTVAESKAPLISAMFAEMEPNDAVEAMLVAQMTATHVAISTAANRMSRQSHSQTRESYERSMTRLSRTFLAQMDALKKHRAKAQQIVRVERVTVNEGGQAIVGDVTHGGGADVQNQR